MGSASPSTGRQIVVYPGAEAMGHLDATPCDSSQGGIEALENVVDINVTLEILSCEWNSIGTANIVVSKFRDESTTHSLLKSYMS